MADIEKTLHISLCLTGENVDQIDIAKIFGSMEGVTLTSGNANLYLKTPEVKVLDKKK